MIPMYDGIVQHSDNDGTRNTNDNVGNNPNDIGQLQYRDRTLIRKYTMIQILYRIRHIVSYEYRTARIHITITTGGRSCSSRTTKIQLCCRNGKVLSGCVDHHGDMYSDICISMMGTTGTDIGW